MQGHGPGMPPRRRGDQFTDIAKAGAPGERSPNSALLIEEGGEARLHPQPRRDAVPADPVIELLVPMIDAALLVAQRHACASRRVDGLLHRVGELHILIDNAIEIGDPRVQQRRTRPSECSPIWSPPSLMARLDDSPALPACL